MIEKHFKPVKTLKARFFSNLFTIPVLLAMFFNLFSPVGTVLAEGSTDTVANGGKRANTEWRTNKTAGYYRRTFFRVYANKDEYILMGSSAMGVGSGDIVLYRESQITNSQLDAGLLASITPTFKCSTYRSTNSGAGTLDTRAKELAGPEPAVGGYKPCVYQAIETGTYWIGMYGPDGVNGNTDGQAGTVDSPVVDATQRSGVSMWDITVRSGSNPLTGTTKSGRVYVDYLAQFAGGNGETNRMYTTLYAVTPDGYVYKVDLNGVDPAGYILYGNRVGFYDADGKTPLYHDVVYSDNSLSTAIGNVILAPASAKFFFQNPLTSDLPVSLLPTPVTPNIENVNFVGTATNDTSYYSQGGIFNYTGNVGGISEIVIQGNTSTDFEPDNPLNRRILSESVVGSNSVTWDGKDNSGNYFPVRSNYPYKVVFHAGEYHFPLLDSENSVLGGPTLTLLNPIGGVCPFFTNCHGAFYDDRVYKTSNGTIVPSSAYTIGNTLPGDTNAINPPTINHSDQNAGFDTSTSQRGYGDTGSNGFGNWKGLDLWTYYPVDAVSKTLNVIATTAHDLGIVKSHSGNFTVGTNSGSFSIVVSNVGTSSIGNVNTSVTDTLPTGMTLYATPTGTNWNCTGAAGTSTFTCNRASGSSNRNLAAGAKFEPITVLVNVASTIASSVTNTATVANVNDGNSLNNSSSDTITIARAELTVSKTDSTAKTATVSVPFNWEITATNSGDLAATFATGATIFSDPLSTDATYGTPTVVTTNVTNASAINCAVASNTLTCTANGSSVVMMATGSSISVVLPVTPTKSGTLANTVTVDPNNVIPEGNESDNTGTDSVTVDTSVINVVKSSTTTAVTAAGQVIPYTFTVTNGGTKALSSVVVTDAKCDVAPTLISGDSNTDLKLDVAETWVYSCNHTVSTEEFTAGSVLSNTVSADSAETEPATSTLDLPVVSLSVTKSAAPVNVPETGGIVTYTFTVKNEGSSALTLTSLSDDKFGALAGDADCKVGTSLAAGATCTFEYSTSISGTAGTNHTNIFTAEGQDAGGNLDSASDDATVTFTDVLPAVSVSKDALPTTLPETGGDVTFTFTVTNSGTVPVSILSLTDSVYGTLSGDDDCKVGTSLASGASCSFTLTKTLSGAFGTSHADIFSAEVEDTEGNKTSDTDDATVVYTDVLPAITASKVASTASVPETGSNVTFTFGVLNSGAVPVSITSLTDSVFGTLDGDSDCQVGTVLTAGASCTFEITRSLSGAVSTPHQNSFTAGAKDADDNPASDSADATVSFADVNPEVTVSKDASVTSVPETGGTVTYTFTVTNSGSVAATITSLVDDVFGTLAGDADCKVGTLLAPGGSCNFTLDKTISGVASTQHINTFTAQVEDAEGNADEASDDASVTFSDVLPVVSVQKDASVASVPETGGNVTFTFTVKNESSVPVSITALTDSVYGVLAGDDDCKVGTNLAAGAECSFTLLKTVSGTVGTPHVNTFSAEVADADGNTSSDGDDASVAFHDVLPSVSVTKSVTPNDVAETGGNVNYTFKVLNDGSVPVTITSLTDDIFGSLSGDDDCKVGTTLGVSESCSFDLPKTLSGATGTTHVNTFSAGVEDSEGNPATDSDSATVTFTDVLPAISVSKDASVAAVPETGANVTFTFTVRNTGTVPANITELSDSVFGTLSGDDDCKVGTALAAAASCDFTKVEFISGLSGAAHTNVFTAKAEDSDGNEASDTDDATVNITDVLPSIHVDKSASASSVLESGEDVTFTFTVENDGTVPVTITDLQDSVYGALTGDADCQVGTTLGVGNSCDFALTEFVSGSSTSTHTNTFTAQAEDSEENSTNDFADAVITFTDVLPGVTAHKSASVSSVPETGANVTFTYSVENTSTVPVTINTLTDDVFGTLSGDADCQVGIVLAAGTSCSFEETHFIGGVVSVPHVNKFNVEVEDADGNTTSDDDDATVNFTDVLPEITATKSASPLSVPETGGAVTFTYTVFNSGDVPVSIDSLNDDIFGVLSGDADCQAGTLLAAGASCSFDVIKTFSGPVGEDHVNVFTVSASDIDGNSTDDSDNASVTFTDVLPAISVDKTASPDNMNEPGGDVTFTYTVNNTGSVPVTITSLTDDVFGTLAGDDDCKVGTNLGAGSSCDFSTVNTIGGVVGTPHQNTFTAEAEDTEGNSTSDSDQAEVTFNDVLPLISVAKAANSTSVDETGGDVTFTYTVTNDGTVPVTIDALSDDVFGTLSGDADCQVGTVLAPEFSCSFTLEKNLSGTAGTSHVNTFTAQGSDSEGNTTEDSAEATVNFTDVLPAITVTKEASETSVLETGENVTFTFTVANTGTVQTEITALEDSVFGTLSGDADCQVGTVLAVGASCSFETTQFLSGSVATPHNNLFTATIKDVDGNTAEDSDDATVTFTDVLPAIVVAKSANPISVAETGGLVTFTYEVSNNGSVPVTLNSLSDDVFGTLSGDADCQVGTELAVGESCSFDTTETLSGSTSAPHVNTFTAEAEDADGNTASDEDNATVNFTDVLPLLSVTKSASPISVPESGGDVTFTFTVNNDGTVPLTLTSLMDSVYGALSGDTDCKVGTELAAGASCSFELVKTLSGSIDATHTNTFTAEGEDSDGNSVSDSDDASVSFTDVAPEIDITKTADPSNVAETGADVTFTFTVSNTGLVSETITSLTDDVFGTLDGDADCKVGSELAAGASCSFTLTESLKGAAGTTHTNVATVYAEDSEGNSANADDDAVVTFTDVLPVITVTKDASPTSVLYTGGEVTFTFTVANSGLVPVTITDLSDDKFGTLTGDEDCEVGTELAAGAECTFEYKTTLSGEPDTVHTNTFTATAIDADENPAEDTDTADVSLLGSAILGVAKELISKTPAAAGTYDVTYQVLVKNYGTKDLFKIQVEDDLATTFPAPTLFSVVSVESSDFAVSSTYDGSTDKKLLAGTDSLLVGESGTITLVVNVTPAKVGPFYNSINGSSETSEGTSVTDISQDGEDPDGKVEEHDDDPTNNSDPTPVSFDTIFNPPLGVKSVDAAAKPVLTWSMSWMNNSNKVPQVAVVHDPIPSKTTYVVDATLIGIGMPTDAPLGSTMEGVSCEAGTSTTTITTMCYYEGPTSKNPRGQIIWAGTLGADYGATDPLAAPNAIHIKFATKNLSGTKYVKNIATIDADLNGDGDTVDTGEIKVDSVSATWGTPPSNHNDPVVSDALIIPQTGFAPGSVTALPLQPLQSTYADLNSLAIEIPALKVKATIVGIPETDSGWNITWLGDEVGWLNGTAFPTWAGNSVLTGHVYNSNGLPGPFANLSSLKFGDQIIIQAFGQEYIYEVRETKEVSPTDVSTLVQHEELPWITLVTCRGYDEASGTYQSRYLVRAVQIKIK